jgi:GT2 family glycosyltransferase
MIQQPITIVIPVYKNYDVFLKYFEINRKYFAGCEIIVINDYPQDNINKQVKKILPEAIIVNNKKNLGFAGSVNKGILQTKRDYIFLMNSDVILQNSSFLKALEYFKKDQKLFAVGFAQIEKDGSIVGANHFYFKDGLINHFHLSSNINQPTFNFWAEGGSSIFRKRLLIDLGLFDKLYNPFYWEDIDLSYRAWKAGYKVLYDPNIKVQHHHESTIRKYFNKSEIQKIAFRNQLIFHWKNLTDRDLIFKHLLNLPRLIFFPGFFDALMRLPKILKSRKKTIELFVKGDKKIIDQFNV